MLFRTLFFCSLLLLVRTISAQTVVSTNSELYASIAVADADSTIIISNGIYSDVFMDIQAIGTYENPIIIRAEIKDSVKLIGPDTQIKIGGSYIYLQGFLFEGIEKDETKLIDFANVTVCDHCKVFNMTFNNLRPDTVSTLVTWINVQGSHNEIAHCSFLNKKTIGSAIRVDREIPITNYHLIHHNYFSGRRQVFKMNGAVFNGQDAIRIGVGTTADSESSCAVFNNYFYDWIGELEVISNKAGNNRYYNNTFRENYGMLSLRHGDNCEVYNNYFFGADNLKAGGVRLVGSGHKIYNNYMEELDHKNSLVLGAISITRGDSNAPSEGYQLVNEATIFNNSIVNCEIGIRIGTQDNISLLGNPGTIYLYNNIMLNTDDAITHHNLAATCQASNNLRENGSWELMNCTGTDNSIDNNLLEMTSDNFYRIYDGSDAKDAATPVPNENLVFDLTNGFRSANFDAGAEEFESMGNHLPYGLNYMSQVGASSGGLFHCYNEDLILDIPVILQKEYQSKKKIIAKGGIEENGEVLFSAAEEILLLPGFSSGTDENFEATITGCSN